MIYSAKLIRQPVTIISMVFLWFIYSSCTKDAPSKKEGWQLSFSDEFSDTILDRTKWKTDYPWLQGVSSPDLQYFIDSAFLLRNGILSIMLKKDTVNGTVWNGNTPSKKMFYYSSGMLESAFSFSQLYGYFEIRAKIPSGQGFWSAFWMMPYNEWPPEIDIFEIDGKKPFSVLMTNHFFDKSGNPRLNASTFHGPNLSQDFHTYAIDWNQSEINWYFDDQLVNHTETGIPRVPMYMLLTLSLGGPLPGDPDQSTPFPCQMDIDYIRVYKKSAE